MRSSKPNVKRTKDVQSLTLEDLKILEHSFRSAANSIAATRDLMSQFVAHDVPLTDFIHANRAKISTESALLSLTEDQADVDAALTAMSPGKGAEESEDFLRQRLAHRLGIEGWAAAGILLCLIRYPGQLLTHAQLAAAARISSSSPGVIRVYICQLRSCLEANGIKGNAIETGRRSYRIVRSAAFEIINSLGVTTDASKSAPGQ